MEININSLIQEVTREYMPLALETKNRDITFEESEKLFKLSTKLELYKIIKSLFMEEITKNKKLVDFLISEGKLTTHIEKVEDDSGKEVEVRVIDQTMDERISMIPEQFSQPIIEKMAKSHVENLKIYKESKNTKLFKKEEYELEILNSWLPKEASREDIMAWLDENYPEGITQKEMGPVIGKTIKTFERVDGKLVSECVKSKLKDL